MEVARYDDEDEGYECSNLSSHSLRSRQKNLEIKKKNILVSQCVEYKVFHIKLSHLKNMKIKKKIF